jgi:serine phosphatase RsbU (regulator of sigma subunit)/ActR/RegA family two-component response regulator
MVQADHPKPKLMVVDDETDNLALLYRTFRRDFQVFKAESAFDALDILQQEGEMAIIISDQQMPRLSGIEFLSRTVELFPDTIRIVLTGYTDAQDLVDAINSGKVFKYITKPWDANDLKAVVFQAAETYSAIKQRTQDLTRSLRRESLFNAVTTAIRESLDYDSMLRTIVETIGNAFGADACMLYPVEHVWDGVHETGAALALPPATQAAADFVLANSTRWVNPQPDQTPPYSRQPLPPVDEAVLLGAVSDRGVQVTHVSHQDSPYVQLIIPLTCKQEIPAVLVLYKQTDDIAWLKDDIELVKGVAEQAALAISQAKLYQRLQKQSEQMQGELAVARQIQSNLLRQRLPDIEEVKIQAHCYPAREVGGDFFEVYLHPQGDVWLAVGDVSGKGVPAALFMASALSVLRRELSQETPPPPNIVMQNLNSSLLDNLVSSNCFITMVLASFSPRNKHLVYANAGHIYPLVWSAPSAASGPSEPHYLTQRGVPLGILPVWNADAGELQLQSGDTLLLASDGVTEATIANVDTGGQPAAGRSMLRQAGLWQLLIQERSNLDLTHVLSRIQSHSETQEDDQTMLSLEVL